MATAATPGSSDYRIAPALAARLVGVSLLGDALLLALATTAVALLRLPAASLLLIAALGLFGTAVIAVVLRRLVVVRLMEHGYRVSMVRGAGVPSARWTDVEDAVATTRLGEKCVLIRLRDGGSTTIPMSAIAADPDDFARDLQAHLRRGSGERPLG
jgi:hypothetical protein